MSSDADSDQTNLAPIETRHSLRPRYAKWLLLFAILNAFAINWALPRLPWQPQLMTTLDYSDAFVKQLAHADSWKAMRTALFYTDMRRQQPIYSALYFDNNVRFQYPPSSLLVLDALRSIGGEQAISDRQLNLISWCCVVGAAVVLVAIFSLSRTRFGAPEDPKASLQPRDRIESGLFALSAMIIAFTFYPLVRGYYLGQIQVWIDFLIALVVWSWLQDRKAISGLFLSLICVIKPTLALIVIWGAIRKEWRFIAGFAAPMSCFALISLYVYGWDNHVDYLGVLSYISQQGEIFHPNQSMNGLLHRLLQNGNSLEWERTVLMTYNPWVHGGTILSTLAIMGIGLLGHRNVQRTPGVLELSIVIVCATLASPTVWTHHYGVMLPLFAIALAAVMNLPNPPRHNFLILLGGSFILISNNFRLLNRLADTPFNVLQSYVYLAGLTFLFLLFRLRSQMDRE